MKDIVKSPFFRRGWGDADISKIQNTNFKKLTPFANKLRNNSTMAEIRLWSLVLKAEQLEGDKFLKQRPIGNYIVDFVCRKLKLVIEVDGITYTEDEALIRDDRKQNEFKLLGYNTIRFTHDEVMNSINGVREYILQWIRDNRQVR